MTLFATPRPLPDATTTVWGKIALANDSQAKGSVLTNGLAITPYSAALHLATIRAYGDVHNSGVLQGSNYHGVASVSISGLDITVNLTSAMVDANYTVVATWLGNYNCNHTLQVFNRTTTSFSIKGMYMCSGSSAQIAPIFTFIVAGRLA